MKFSNCNWENVDSKGLYYQLERENWIRGDGWLRWDDCYGHYVPRGTIAGLAFPTPGKKLKILAGGEVKWR